MKIVILLLAVALLLWLLFGRSRRGSSPRTERRPDVDKVAEGMVACAHCGVNVPVSEALRLGDQSYCSDAHRLAGPRPS
jgi:uncharacterized protein